MVDWLEELLARLEEREEEQGEVLALRLGAAAPAPPVPEAGTGEALENSGEEAGPALEEESIPAEAGGLELRRKAKAAVLEGQDGALELGGLEAGVAEAQTVEGEMAGPFWNELEAVMGPGGIEALRGIEAAHVELAELGGAAERTAGELDTAADAAATVERGLEGLYRQALQASRPAAQGLLAEEAGRTVRVEEPGRTAALTVDELDRAVRRDSRRYDGGMTIF